MALGRVVGSAGLRSDRIESRDEAATVRRAYCLLGDL